MPKNRVPIFDEIQACPELAVLSAGSLIGIHLNPESFPVGKVEFISLYPMTFEEFLLGIQDLKGLEYPKNLASITSFAHTHLLGQFKEYMISGGMALYPNINLKMFFRGRAVMRNWRAPWIG